MDQRIYLSFVSADKRMTSQKLRAGRERLAQQRELRELQRRPQTNTTHRKGGALHSEGSRADIIMKVLAFGFYNLEY